MILGAVLAGGRATRFGSDKAAALWNGAPLIDHVIGRLTTVVTGIIVCGRVHSGAISVADRPAPDLGPLGGLNAALHHGASNGYDHVITVPCDTPLLDEALLSALRSAEGEAFLAGMPVIGKWRCDGASLLDELLRAGGNRSMRNWTSLRAASPLFHPEPPNINRKADLETLLGA
jgi:molybdopterin-guanine dinucleotide biosynthesis protein A